MSYNDFKFCNQLMSVRPRASLILLNIYNFKFIILKKDIFKGLFEKRAHCPLPPPLLPFLQRAWNRRSFSISSFLLDISRKSGGLLVYVKAKISSCQLSLPKFQFRKQALLFELNLRKEKWWVILIYRSPWDSLSRVLESLTGIIDFFF